MLLLLQLLKTGSTPHTTAKAGYRCHSSAVASQLSSEAVRMNQDTRTLPNRDACRPRSSATHCYAGYKKSKAAAAPTRSMVGLMSRANASAVNEPCSNRSCAAVVLAFDTRCAAKCKACLEQLPQLLCKIAEVPRMSTPAAAQRRRLPSEDAHALCGYTTAMGQIEHPCNLHSIHACTPKMSTGATCSMHTGADTCLTFAKATAASRHTGHSQTACTGACVPPVSTNTCMQTRLTLP